MKSTIARDVLDRMRANPAFGACSPSGLRRLAELGTEVSIPAGTVLVSGRGRPQTFVVFAGVARRSVDGVDAGVLERGAVFEDAGPRARGDHEVVAVTDMDLLVLHPGEVAMLLHQEPALASTFRTPDEPVRLAPVARVGLPVSEAA